MIAYLSPLESEYKGGFFQKQSSDKVISGVGFFSNIGHILSVDCISSVDWRSECGGVMG